MVNDLNEDGAPDVVGFSYPVTHALHIFLGLGDGTFHQPQTLVFSSGPGGTAIGDFNGDGLADLAVTMFDLTGKIVHTWKMPYPPGLYGCLTEKGTLFYNGKIPNETFLGKAPFKGGAALEADWNGKVLWEVRHPDHHHDGRLLKNGNVLLLCATELSNDVARKIQGGRSGTEEKGKIWADYLVEMTKDGRTGNGAAGSISIRRRT